MSTEGEKKLESAIKLLKKDYNVAFFKLGEKVDRQVPVIPTGIFGIDHHILGVGGIPQGRISELYGSPSGGKSTLMLQIIAQAQKMGKKAAFIDAEHALDPSYAAALGVDTDELLCAQPDCGEEAIQAAIELTDTGEVGIVVIDSVAALVPRAELSGEVEDAHVGLQARLMAKGLRKITAMANRTGTAIVFSNQVRDKIGVTFGAKTTTPGGRSLPFFASVRLEIARVQQIKEKDENVGNLTNISGRKNKMSTPFREAKCDLVFGKGFDAEASLTDFAIAHDVWRKSGSSYMFVPTGEAITGRNNLRDELKENTDLRKATTEATLKAMGRSDEYIASVMNG